MIRQPPRSTLFPTRRSSDLPLGEPAQQLEQRRLPGPVGTDQTQDRKSTRLNSSHSQNSYAVFCLKKKNVGQIFHAPGAAGFVQHVDDLPVDHLVALQLLVEL